MTHLIKITQFTILLVLIFAVGCSILPERRFKPTLHNPHMQLREVAIVPFLNRSGNLTVDGEEFAQLYGNQLQRVPGYHVTAVETVKQAMIDLNLTKFTSVDDIRTLGEYLNVDVVVLGSINQYTSYQPPHITLEVEWYATNPYFHPIVAGHGLPWGTPAEKEIPDAVLLQVEQDLARAQLATQTPDPKAVPLRAMPQNEEQFGDDSDTTWGQDTNGLGSMTGRESLSIPNMALPDASYLPPSLESTQKNNSRNQNSSDGSQIITAYYPQYNRTEDGSEYEEENFQDAGTDEYLRRQQETIDELSQRARGVSGGPKKSPSPNASRQYLPYEKPKTVPSRRISDHSGRASLPANGTQAPTEQAQPIVMGYIPAAPDYGVVMPGMPVGQGMIAGEPAAFPGLPANWPDPRGLIPDGPQATPSTDLTVNNEPVMRHVATYNGNDVNFTRRLADYESLFLDDRRIGGWQGILRRRTDFIGACCCMHIWEMLSSRGGAGKAERISTQEKFWMNP